MFNLKIALKNFSYSFFANFISIGVSIVMVTIVPRLLPLEDYGMWQLFLFYFSYLGFFHFGWEDGIYLRYAGCELYSLDRKKFSGQFYSLIALQIVLMILAMVLAIVFVDNNIKRNVFICAASLLVFVNFNNLCNFILRITYHIKSYAYLLLSERLSLLALILAEVCMGYYNFCYLYYAKVFSIVSVSALSAYYCRILLYPSFDNVKSTIMEAKENISVGSKLMIANIASMLIIGIVRYGISEGWSIVTFGKVSLTLGISNFLMIFISAVSVVFFPILKHVKSDQLANIYIKIRDILTIIILGLLVSYYPIRSLLAWWLPKYADSLIYMAVLFPVCLFESRVSLLTNTYMQSMRQEKLILKINGCILIISVLTTLVTVVCMHNLSATVLSIVFLYGSRCLLAEYFMQDLLAIDLRREQIKDIVIILVFMLSGWLINSWACTFIYGVAYIVYLTLNREKVNTLVQFIKKALIEK